LGIGHCYDEEDSELLLQEAFEQDPEVEKDDEGLVKQIRATLCSTEVSECVH